MCVLEGGSNITVEGDGSPQAPWVIHASNSLNLEGPKSFTLNGEEIWSWDEHGHIWANRDDGVVHSGTRIVGQRTAPLYSPLYLKPHIDAQSPRRVYMASVAINEVNEVPEWVSRRQVGHFGRAEPAISTLMVPIADIRTMSRQTISFKQRDGGVATLTTTGTHGYTVGQKIAVHLGTSSLADKSFDGMQTLTAVTANTFSFANAGTSIPQTAVTGGGYTAHGQIVIALPPGRIDGYWGQSFIGQDNAPLFETKKAVVHKTAYNMTVFTYEAFDIPTRTMLGVSTETVYGLPDFDAGNYVGRISESGASAMTLFAQNWLGPNGFQSRMASIGMEAAEDHRLDGYGGIQSGGRINFMATSFGPRSQRIQKESIEADGTHLLIGSWAEELAYPDTLGRRLVVAAMQPIVAEIFKISRFNLVFEVFATLREALASVSPQAAEAFDRA